MAAVPLATVAIGFAPLALFADELPDRVATHYSTSGRPDGSMTIAQFALTTGAMMAIGIAMLVTVALTSRRRPDSGGRWLFGGFLAGLGAGVFGAEIVAQRGNDHWVDATSPAWVLGGSLLIAVVVGAIAARLAALLPSDGTQDHEQAALPVLAMTEGEHAV